MWTRLCGRRSKGERLVSRADGDRVYDKCGRWVPINFRVCGLPASDYAPNVVFPRCTRSQSLLDSCVRAGGSIVYCPKCRAEYREGFTECSDCRVPLIAERPPVASALWERPSNKRRRVSALTDLVVWTTLLWVVWQGTMDLAYARFGRPIHTGPDPRDEVTVLSLGFAALCANLYLGITNGVGWSLGKALNGLRLVTFVGEHPARPGVARGLVRSALQAGPWMGGLMVLTGFHDAFAGTRIVEAPQWDAPYPNSPSLPRIAAWKIVAAVFLHLFFAMVYVVIGAI